jgi:Regulator of ribonuclease activity B
MKRDYLVFPDDENGDVLWRMAEQGDNLAIAREVNFSVIFPNEASALKFAVYLLRNGHKVSFSEYEEQDELPWQVEVHPVMLPTHKQITDFEKLLANTSHEHGGQNDGWGSFEQS